MRVGVCAVACRASAKKRSRAEAAAVKMRAGLRRLDAVWIGNVLVYCGVMAGSPVASEFIEDNQFKTLQ
jgi:hypothetical protein